jgi:hypothetical protein
MASQVASVLKTATWPEGGGSLVFGDRMVWVVAGVPEEEQLPPSGPFALVQVNGGTVDVDDPNLVEQEFSVLVVADVVGDDMGEAALLGGSLSALGASANRGVLELNDRVRAALQDLHGADGANLYLHAASTGEPVRLGRGRHLAVGETRFRALCTMAPEYEPPSRLAEAADVWTWDGAAAAARYDFVRYRLGYVDGAAPAETPASATIVYTGTAATTTVAPVAGKAYSVWADYSHRGSASLLDGSSDGREVGAFLTT